MPCILCSNKRLWDSKSETVNIFTAEEGGAEHAHVDNRQIDINSAADRLSDSMEVAFKARGTDAFYAHFTRVIISSSLGCSYI